MPQADSTHKRFPESGEAWEALRVRLEGLGEKDVDWRNKKSAVYVFHPGEDVLQVAKEAYALYQSENALGPAAFPSLKPKRINGRNGKNFSPSGKMNSARPRI